jgi:hypothetical protein
MGSRVPKNGEPTQVPSSQERGTHPGSGFRVLGNGKPGKIRSPRSFENRVPIHKNPSGFRILGNGEPKVDFAFPVLGNAEPACVPRSRERNPKLTPLPPNTYRKIILCVDVEKLRCFVIRIEISRVYVVNNCFYEK